MWVEDLFRYGPSVTLSNGNIQAGPRSFDTNAGTQAFFSINGGYTDLAQFNQQDTGDFNDWVTFDSPPPGFPNNPAILVPQVQDAFATPGTEPVLGVELTVLDALGYTPVTTTTSGGTWTQLTNQPTTPIGTMMLLPNGTVMAQGAGGDQVTNTWYQLTPNASGSYDDGSWSNLASMNTQRLYYGSVVLPSGNVMVYGGEYSGSKGLENDLSAGEIYDPASNSWTTITVPSIPGYFGGSPGDITNTFGDDMLEVLPDGNVLAGYLAGPQTFLYNPSTNSWSLAGTKLDGDPSDEENWVKLPNGDILTYDLQVGTGTVPTGGQYYDPTTNKWYETGPTPSGSLTNGLEEELGPPMLLPDGNVFYVGANDSYTALYDPSTNTWSSGPIIPGGMVADDAPAAILPDGNVIFAADAASPTGPYASPSALFEYNPASNTIVRMATPPQLNQQLGSGAFGTNAFEFRMLVLPNGQVLMEDGSSVWTYSETATAQSSWRPAITSIANNGDNFTVTGTQLNGMSEGASYGDDAQMAENYPIVSFTSASGAVSYATTSNWTSVGVQTGNTPVSADFTGPPGFGDYGPYLMSVSAAGISSPTVLFIDMGPGANNITLQLDPSNHSKIQVLENGTTLLGEFALSSFTGIYVNGYGDVSENYANGTFGPVHNNASPPQIVVTTASDDPSHTGVSLRDAIATADGDTGSGVSPTITFAADLSGSTITLTQGALELLGGSGTMTIDGAGGITVSGAGSWSVFQVDSGAQAVMDGLTIVDGKATYGGGIDNGGSLTISDATLSGNSATSEGGGIFNAGTLIINNSTLSSDSASTAGGGIFTGFSGGTLTVDNCTISGDSATDGGGIENDAAMTVNNSTFADNVGYYGGGIALAGGSATLNNTIVANDSAVIGPDVYFGGGTVAANYSLIGHTTSSNISNSSGVGNVLNPISADLTPLGSYGGPTETIALLPISPAIGAGEIVGGVMTDQRGFARPGSQPDIGAFETQAGPYVVTTAADPVGSPGQMSLRQAVNLANAYTIALFISPTVTFAANLNGSTITLTQGPVMLAAGNGTTTINGGGQITVSGNNSSGVFDIAYGAQAVLTGLTIENGDATYSGGGIYNLGSLTVSNATLLHNTAASGEDGGGIYNDAGSLTVIDVTLSGNSADSGGGIYNESGSVTISNTTLSGNSADSGGGIYNDNDGVLSIGNSTLAGNSAGSGGAIDSTYGTLNVSNSTLTANKAQTGGGIDFLSGSATLTNSIIAGNSASTGPDIDNEFGTVALTSAYDMVGNTAESDIGSGNGNVLNPTVVGLSGLGKFGGPTETIALLPGSSAIGVGELVGFVNTDQRGLPRPSSPSQPDIGAFQTQIVGSPSLIEVTTAVDPGDIYGQLSLREAVNLGNAYSAARIDSTIIFASSLNFDTITLTQGALEFTAGADLTTVSAGANSVNDGTDITISGNNASTVFEVDSGAHAELYNLTIADGNSQFSGGGVSNDGSLSVVYSTVTGNTAEFGAGIFNNIDGSLRVEDSTIADNTAADDGGGIFNDIGGTLTVISSTVAENTAQDGGGIFFGYGTATLTNTIVAANTAATGPDIDSEFDTPITSTYSLIGNTTASGISAGTGDVLNPTDLGLSALGSYGGRNQTIALLPGSAAIAAGSTTLSIDQRGDPRPASNQDIGAYQTQQNNFLVTTADDPGGLAVRLSLREAVNLANAYEAAGFSASITFSSSLNFNTVMLTQGPMQLTAGSGTTTVNGGGVISVSGNNEGSVFEVGLGATVVLEGLTIEDGNAQDGGGIYNDQGTLTVSNSTIEGNYAQTGGGIYNYFAGKLTVINSTLTGNTAAFAGGGIFSDFGTLAVESSTLVGNSAQSGGGINFLEGSAGLANSIVAGNFAVTGPDIDDQVDVGAATFCCLIGTTAGSDISGGTGDILNPAYLGISSLGSYGTSIQTFALLPGSPALGSGENIAGITTDERGVTRSASSPDIGAFQSQGFTITPLAGGTPQAANAGSVFANPLAVSVQANASYEPVNGGAATFSAGSGPGGSSATLGGVSSIVVVISTGQAGVSATANGFAGSYTVTAAAAGAASPADFNLSNIVQSNSNIPVPLGPSGTITPNPGYDLPTFFWSSVSTAQSYNFYLYDNTVKQALGGIIGVGSTTWTPSTALTPGHNFTWYVGSVISAGQAVLWSTGANFTLAPLPAPTPLGPSGTITANTGFDVPTFSWSSVPGANSYSFYLYDSTASKSIGGIIGVNGTTWAPAAPLTPGDSFAWYVASVSSNGQETVWTTTAENFSLAALAAPTPLGPGGTITAASGFDLPTFSWTSVTAASGYSFYLYDSTAMKSIGGIINVSGTSWAPSTALTPGDSFAWYVASVSTNGQETVWDTAENFLLAALAAPTPLGPSGTITAGTGFDFPTFSWTSVTAASSYSFYLYDSTAMKSIGGIIGVAGTSWTPMTALTPGDTFAWYVASVSTNGQEIVWNTTAENFSLAALAAPTPLGPSGTITAGTGFDFPTFSWTSVTGASSYSIYLYDSTAMKSVGGIIAVAGTSWTPMTALTPGDSFAWYIASVSTNGQEVAWNTTAENFSLTALSAPTPLGPSGTITAVTGFDFPTFSWTSVTGASSYSIYLYDSTAMKSIGGIIAVAGTSWTPPTALTPGDSFAWYVASVSTNGQEVVWNTTAENFTLAALSAPTPLGPSGTITAGTGFDSPTFSWTGVAGANSYSFYLYDSTANKALNGGIVNLGGTSWTPTTALTPGDKYVWYVASVSTNGQEAVWNTGANFTLAALSAPMPISPAGTLFGNAGPTFTWSKVPGTNSYAFYLFDNTASKAIGGGIIMVDGTSWPDTTALTTGDSYTWYVGAVSTNGLETVWSTGLTFRVASGG